MIRINTQTSVYLFDEGGRYMRMPNLEGRERESDEQWMQILSGGFMDDHRWNPLREVHFIHHPHPAWQGFNDSLNIQYEGSITGIVTTPVADESVEDAKRLVAQFEILKDSNSSSR